MAKIQVTFEFDNVSHGDYFLELGLWKGDRSVELLHKEVAVSIPGSDLPAPSVSEPVITVS